MIQLKLETYNKICENLVTQKEELRKKNHALWMARALRAAAEWNQAMNGIGKFDPEKWKRVERKCLEKAKEFE